eukprot:jgi/Psemu1/224987/e_gw1.1550.14.1
MDGISNTEGQDSPKKSTEDRKAKPTTCWSVSECTFVSNFWRAHTDKEWIVKEEEENNGNHNNDINDRTEDDVAGVSFQKKTRLVPLPSTHFGSSKGRRNSRTNDRNRDTWFHQDLKTDDLDGMVVMFQAKANESIAIVLSCFPSYHSKNSIDGKMKRSSNKDSFSFVSIPSRICRDNDVSWTSYWVCLSNCKLYVGMGSIPGKDCFGVMEKQGEEKEEQEGAPSSGVTKETENATAFLPIRYVGIGNDAKNHKTTSTIEVRNLVVTNVPPCLESLLKKIPSQDELPIICLPPVSSSSSMDIDEDAETLELKRYMEQYKAECLVRKRRAQKYGTQYTEQPMKDFLPWTMAKRLLLSNQQSNQRQSTTSHSSGFEAGAIDFLDPKEVSKREARLARFAAAASTESKAEGDENKGGEDEKTSVVVAPIITGLPVEQAWDKEDMLRPVRRDPPPYLWKECPSNAETIGTFKNPPDPFAMYDETTKAATWIEDKLHVSAIDWAAFKQIGNDDLLKHFGESYGPIKYIEWLGDVNCNICFGSKQSAARALVCLSNELPSPPLLSAKDDASSSVGATSIDLGCMTWKFGKKPIRKLSNDRRGRKGTTARYLLRMATTEDVLVERPNHWPEPPGGFSSDRVLGPKKNDNQNQNTNERNNNTKHNKKNNTMGHVTEGLLNRGLSSSRAGFSVEEMEKERQTKKRQKTC